MRKRIPDWPEDQLNEGGTELRLEQLSAEQIAATYNPGHTRAFPRRMSGPVIACEHDGRVYILDGTNRLNVWLRDGDRELHDAIVVKRKAVDGA